MRAILIALTVLAAGCLGGEPVEPAADDLAPVLVTDPTDVSALGNMSTDGRPHLHDYWRGKDRLEIVSETQTGGGLWFGEPMPWLRFLPPAGNVVPLGAGRAHITVTWVDGNEASYAPPELWVKTAADREAFPVKSPLQNGEIVEMPIAIEENDLPHQSVSAWEFQFVLARPDEVRPLMMNGDVTVTVVVERVHEIPLFPPHPDLWNGSAQIPLLDDGDDSFFIGDTDGGWSCMYGCPRAFRPADGVIVPPDASYVEVILTHELGRATRLGLSYHAADAREFVRVAPVDDAGAVRTYRVAVAPGMGDGPYSKQSLWEFLPYIEEPTEDAVFRDAYRVSAVAHR